VVAIAPAGCFVSVLGNRLHAIFQTISGTLNLVTNVKLAGAVSMHGICFPSTA
jgi:hypothetical protein